MRCTEDVVRFGSIARAIWTAGSQDIVHAHDDHTNQSFSSQRVDLLVNRVVLSVAVIISLIDEERTWVESMLSQTSTAKTINCF